jgi:hypothetical protein
MLSVSLLLSSFTALDLNLINFIGDPFDPASAKLRTVLGALLSLKLETDVSPLKV